MNPLSEILRTFASTPLAPSSRIFASSSTGTRAQRRRSVASSAMRALIIPKLISIRRLLQRRGERQADPAVLDPPHLCPDDAMVKELQRQPLTYVRNVREDHHCARFRHVDQLDHVLAAAEFEHGGVRDRRRGASPAVRRSARFSLRGIIEPSRTKPDATRPMPPHSGEADLSQRRLRIGLRRRVAIIGGCCRRDWRLLRRGVWMVGTWGIRLK